MSVPADSPRHDAAYPETTGSATADADLTSFPTELFTYELPPELIAQAPATPRDSSRLLVLDRATGLATHATFREIGRWLRPGDLLVANRSRVVPARLRGRRVPSGGRVELLLLRRVGPGCWEALVRPGKNLAPGTRVELAPHLSATIVERTAAGGRLIRFEREASDDAVGGSVKDGDVDAAVLTLGSLPLPPYIRDFSGDPERYQTVYGDALGSAAAPTAGLHFTPELLSDLRTRGVGFATVTLHVGLDTFRPVKAPDLREHEIHSEVCAVPEETARAVAETKARGGRVVAVGTTTVRSLETAAAAFAGAPLTAWSGDTRLYILPGHRFRAVDAIITNFHLSGSTLLALVSAFAGRERVLAAYAEAIERRYRFFSFGDAMLIV